MQARTLSAALLLAASPAAALVVQPSLPMTETSTFAGTATIAVGEPLLVMLPTQAGTGYSWEVRPADPAVLETQTAHCSAARGDARVGATVPSCFAWAGRAPGQTTLTFVYRRHWETQPDGVLRYNLAVTVGR